MSNVTGISRKLRNKCPKRLVNPILAVESQQNVWLQDSNSRQWKKGVVREKCPEPSYQEVEQSTEETYVHSTNHPKQGTLKCFLIQFGHG